MGQVVQGDEWEWLVFSEGKEHRIRALRMETIQGKLVFSNETHTVAIFQHWTGVIRSDHKTKTPVVVF